MSIIRKYTTQQNQRSSAAFPVSASKLSTEEYLKAYAKINHHAPATYQVGDKKVTV